VRWFRPISQPVHRFGEYHDYGVCSSIQFTLLRDASEHYTIPNIGQLFQASIEENQEYTDGRLLLRYNQNALKVSIFIILQNAVLYWYELFHSPTSVEHPGLDSKVECIDANQGIIRKSHNIWVHYMERDLDNTFQCWIQSFPVLYFCWTTPNEILQCREPLLAGNTILQHPNRCKKTQHWIAHC